MRIDLAPTIGNNLTLLNLSHGEESVTWNASAYERAEFANLSNLFDNINSFWTSLPEKTLDAIWQCYQRMYVILTSTPDAYHMHAKLQKEVKVLYELMPFETVRTWVAFYGDVKVPVTIKDHLSPGDMIERTYLRNDYIDLAALAIALRPMIPVWGEYIGVAKDQNGSEFKEFVAMGLLYYTQLINSPTLEKLRAYVVSTMAFQEPSAAAIIKSLGTAETPDWIMARCLTRRIALAEVDNPDEQASIISNVYRFISSNAKSMDRTFDGRVNEKNKATGSNEEDNSSLMEMYKVKQEFSDGDLVALIVYTENVSPMALRIDRTLPRELLVASLEATVNIERYPILEHQVLITQWVMAPAIPPKGIPFLTKPALLRAMAVTQAVLWHWGFYDLAALVMAVPKVTSKDSTVGSLENRGRIPREVGELLTVRYPHYRKSRSRDKSVRQLNAPCRAIDGYCDMIMHTDWQLFCPPALLDKANRFGKTNRMIVPTDIRGQLGNLIIEISTRY